MITGNDIIIKSYDTSAPSTEIILGASKSCTITEQAELIEVSSPSTGKSHTYIPGKKGWSVTIDRLLLNFKDGFLRVGKEVKLEMGSTTKGTRLLSADKLTGNAICTEYTVVAQKGSLATGKFTFQGNGDLS